MKFSPGEINIICTQLDKSLAFYRDVLGYHVVEKDNGAIRLALGAQFLLLLPIASSPAVHSPYGTSAEVSFDLLTTDLAAAVGYLESCNVKFEKPWQAEDPSVVILDPDGLRIEIVASELS